LQPEVADVGDRIVEAERDLASAGDGERLVPATGGDGPRAGIGDRVSDRAAENGADAAVGDVADQLLPDEPVDVVVGLDVEAGCPPDVGDRFDPRRRRALALAQPDELETVMVDVSRLHDRSAEAPDDA